MICCAVCTETETHHHMSLHYLTSHYIIYYLLCAVFPQKEQHTIAFHCISLHHTSHYIILHNITSRYITLVDLYTFMYKMILWYICVYIYVIFLLYVSLLYFLDIYIYYVHIHLYIICAYVWEWPVVLRQSSETPQSSHSAGLLTGQTSGPVVTPQRKRQLLATIANVEGPAAGENGDSME